MTSLPIQTALDASLDFVLPAELEATRPPEARGLARDEVRLMVSYRANDHILHDRFREIEHFLEPGDLLVVNTSGTMNAALSATRADGTPLEVHLSTHLPANLWIVEVRLKQGERTFPFSEMQAGERVPLPGGASLHLLTPYSAGEGRLQPARQRLWIATIELASPLQEYLASYGFPIRYNYVPEAWPLEYYQTVYATEYGSAEMPSAGRAFTPELIARLVARGIQIVPLLLHTGVSSLEEHEPPYEEYYRVPVETAKSINTAHANHKRVVAVGTTVVRALETVTDVDGVTHPGEGWTRLVITPQRGLRAVNALLTGLHEPRASHLLMLEALAGREHLRKTYAAALQEQYLWHEFGDLHLLLP
ncbi:S-adenosylmethionine:tRNA ribosyltransferase-isomerase [Ktedonobacter racemifer]|uniref:Queuosine biosynthesis protein n=1 Tax=Ktedonobacter racemifer DSM 44963 TaxID=485913 RepID=D6U0Z3_KTERA|nr:S-adenosylmethionine:tRNA ribosyltransferase-isomerase [Ktedonobacter racemifer]EFH82483.1 Queuosine biosynthesis protein [Ktedonobacter racemifer DSM 44963]